MKVWLRVTGIGVLVLAGVLLAIRLLGTAAKTSDAYVTGHVHPITARVAGTVLEVRVDDNQHVHRNDVLVVLDPEDFKVRDQLSRAQIAQAHAQVAAAVSQIAQAQAVIASTSASLEKARLDLKRATELIGESPRGISQQEYDAARASFDAASAARQGANAQLATAQANQQAAEAQIATGEANLRDAGLALSYTEIRAPIDGYVGRKTVETGARINPGQLLMALVEDDLWVVANYKETQLRDIRVGSPVRMTIDAIPGVVFGGQVDSFSPASGAEFSLLPPDNATGNFTKVVQRVPVKIRFDAGQLGRYRRQLIPGLSVETKIQPAASAVLGKVSASTQP